MMDIQRLKIAYFLGEYATAESAIAAMIATGTPVSIRDFVTVNETLAYLFRQWEGRLPVTEEDYNRIIADARAYCALHGDELEELLTTSE